MNHTTETSRSKAANVIPMSGGLTHGQLAASHLGQCAMLVESLETAVSKQIGSELRQFIFKIEHLPGRCKTLRAFESRALTPQIKALEHLQYCRAILLLMSSAPSKSIEQELAPYALEISGLKAGKVRIM